METVLIRQVRLRARHHYGVPGRSEEENRRRFGAQAESHEHEWCIRLEIRGPSHPETGFVVDLDSLDEALERILGPWRGADLNQRIPEVRDGRMQPSTESLARWLHGRLAPSIMPPAGLVLVEVWESATLGARYPA